MSFSVEQICVDGRYLIRGQTGVVLRTRSSYFAAPPTVSTAHARLTSAYLLNSNVGNERNGEEIDFSQHSKLFNTWNVM